MEEGIFTEGKLVMFIGTETDLLSIGYSADTYSVIEEAPFGVIKEVCSNDNVIVDFGEVFDLLIPIKFLSTIDDS